MGLFSYIVKRILFSIPVIIIISIVCFGIIQLPPGDYADAYAAVAASTGGGSVSKEYIEQIRERYGLDQPFWIQYWRWVKGFPEGDFGIAMSLQGTPVTDILKERLPVEDAKIVFDLKGNEANVTIPEEILRADGLQIMKHFIQLDIFKFVKTLEKINFVETHINKQVSAKKPKTKENTSEQKTA